MYRGIIYEKDFGADATKVAAAMTIFDTNDSQSRYEEPEANQEETHGQAFS